MPNSTDRDDDRGHPSTGLPDEPDPEAQPTNPSSSVLADALGGWLRTIPGLKLSRSSRSYLGEIWSLAWPVILSQVLVTAVALVDIAMVGRLGPKAVAAVGYATQFFFMIQSALFAVGFACVAVMARAIGADDPARARAGFAASLLIAFGTALVVGAAVMIWARAILSALNAEADVVELCVPYLRLVLASTMIQSIVLVTESALRADRDAKTPMKIAGVVGTIKVLLNWPLIFGFGSIPRLEVAGAGVATLISQIIGVTLCMLAIARLPTGNATALRPVDLPLARQMLRPVTFLALPGIAERMLLNLALLAYFSILGIYGTIAVAAYTVGVRTLSFSWIPGTGFAAAVATLVGQALGRHDRQGAYDVAWVAVRLSLGVAVVLGLVAGFAREPIARLFTDHEATVQTLGPFMLCVAIAQPMLQAHFTLGGIHRGAGDTWTPLLAAAVGNWVVRVPLAVIFALVLGADLVWVWVALIFDHLARTIWLARSFFRRKWLTKV